jgi:predicted ArsR family transcriptional regulator
VAVEHPGERTRERILEALGTGEAKHPLQLAVELGLHGNTVRRHLEILEGAGRVERVQEVGGLPGRPRVLYSASDSHADDCTAGYRFLARAMSSFVTGTHEDPWDAGSAAGEAWGEHLVEAEPYCRADDATAIERAFRVLEDLGYAPSEHSLSADEVCSTTALGQCPFPELASDFPGLICGFHYGLIKGALQRLGAHLSVEQIDINAPDGPCVLGYARLEDRAPSAQLVEAARVVALQRSGS